MTTSCTGSGAATCVPSTTCWQWIQANCTTSAGGKSILKSATHFLSSRSGDVVEACTGIYFVAERVPELHKFLDCDLLPEGVSSWMILHSLSDSIKNFVGWRSGSKAKKKEVGFLRSWTASRVERYLRSSLHYPAMGVSDQRSNKPTSTASDTATRRKFGD